MMFEAHSTGQALRSLVFDRFTISKIDPARRSPSGKRFIALI
jgi:tagatose-1,6-bisphosphate aldolase non-catalytic subunit AgaZ/GatZ